MDTWESMAITSFYCYDRVRRRQVHALRQYHSICADSSRMPYAHASCCGSRGVSRVGSWADSCPGPKKENASEMPLHILDQYPAARSVSRKGRLNGTVNRLNKVNATKIVVISLCENVVLPADPSEETPGKCRKKNAITIAAT